MINNYKCECGAYISPVWNFCHLCNKSIKKTFKNNLPKVIIETGDKTVFVINNDKTLTRDKDGYLDLSHLATPPKKDPNMPAHYYYDGKDMDK